MQRVLTPDKTVSGLSNPLIELLRTRLPGMVIGWRVSKSDFRPLRNRDAFGSASRQTLLISARPAQNIDQIITQDNSQSHNKSHCRASWITRHNPHSGRLSYILFLRNTLEIR